MFLYYLCILKIFLNSFLKKAFVTVFSYLLVRVTVLNILHSSKKERFWICPVRETTSIIYFSLWRKSWWFWKKPLLPCGAPQGYKQCASEVQNWMRIGILSLLKRAMLWDRPPSSQYENNYHYIPKVAVFGLWDFLSLFLPLYFFPPFFFFPPLLDSPYRLLLYLFVYGQGHSRQEPWVASPK